MTTDTVSTVTISGSITTDSIPVTAGTCRVNRGVKGTVVITVMVE